VVCLPCLPVCVYLRVYRTLCAPLCTSGCTLLRETSAQRGSVLPGKRGELCAESSPSSRVWRTVCAESCLSPRVWRTVCAEWIPLPVCGGPSAQSGSLFPCVGDRLRREGASHVRGVRVNVSNAPQAGGRRRGWTSTYR